MTTVEVNFDAIVGPTHNYSGLSYGNLASMAQQGSVSHPKEAALQGLKKMKLLADLGVPQAVLPPQIRPSVPHLRSLGFNGSDERIFLEAKREAPLLLFLCSSASAMWAANSATVTPSTDSRDGRVHFTIANLLNRFHRSIEAETTFATFRTIFKEDKYFAVHPPLHKGGRLGDEGAANHTRFCKEQGGKGVHLFVYSSKAFGEETPTKFPLRQSLEASQAIARKHGIPPDQVVFAEQNQEIIEEGVFHNDVISVGHENFFLLHEKAFANTAKVLEELDFKLQKIVDCPLIPFIIREKDLPVKQAVNTYLFNSQIVRNHKGKRIMIAPQECAELSLNLPFEEVHYVNLLESMQNGGGPACLRLRVVLNENELAAVPQGYFLNTALYEMLVNWVDTHYREDLTSEDLFDPALLRESKKAIAELETILQ